MWTDDDRRWMAQALLEARRAGEEGEIPIGAVVVSGGRIIGRGHNMTQQLHDVTAHAEIIALTAATQATGGKYLPDSTLYVTVEPCCMCAGATGWAQVNRVVYGAPDAKRGYTTIVRTDRTPFHPKALIQSGLMADECAALMRTFFHPRR